MKNDLTALPWAAGQLHVVENYWEAAGVLAALSAGIAPESVRRPLSAATVVKRTAHPDRTVHAERHQQRITHLPK